MGEFEVYQNQRGRTGIAQLSYPAIAIAPSSARLSFNRAAAEHLGISQRTRGLVLLFNREEGIVAMRAPSHQELASVVMKISWAANGGGSVSISGFAKFYGIDLKQVKGDHRLGHDERLDLHMFRLPRGSWEKPPGQKSVGLRSRLSS